MLDINKTIELIRGGLLEPASTWQSYLSENRSWRETALLLTGPLVVASFVLSALLSWVFGSYYLFNTGMGPGAWLLSLLMTIVGIGAAAFIFSYLAGVFKGRHDFDRGLAAVSLAAIPGYVGGVLGTIPFIGWIIGLALSIVTLVFLYQIIPSYLGVPQDKRVLHYIASLVATFAIMLILSAALGAGGVTSLPREPSMTSAPSGHTGMFGGIQRYAEMTEKAEQDRYDPPGDGRITEAQMTAFMQVMRKSAEIRKEQSARMERLKKQYEQQGSEPTDLGALAGSVGSMLGAFNAEMEVVMTGEGNWAEHQWIKEQLRVARIQKDINEAVQHNYALYQAYRDELEQLGVPW